MNKKGTLVHWIILGLLVALGIFFLMSEKSKFGIDVKGEWQLDFLKENFLEAEKKLLQTDSIVKNIGTGFALDLAENGGFEEGTGSDCGEYNGINTWNKKNKWCFTYQNLSQMVVSMAGERLSEKLPQNFSEININGFFLTGKGKQDNIVTKNARYSYDTSFAVNLGYSFEEYALLEQEAHRLVTNCQNEKELKDCLDQLKLNYWKYSSCDAEEESYSESLRKVLFCVVSPNLAYLPVGGSSEQKLINYKLALDFTPTKPFAVEAEVSYDLDKDFYEISFEQDLWADSYNLHYTNWPSVLEKKGLVEEVFSLMVEGFGYFHKTVSFANPEKEDCPSDKKAGNVYLCSDKVVYVLKDEELVLGGRYFFAVTSVWGEEESEILEFKEV